MAEAVRSEGTDLQQTLHGRLENLQWNPVRPLKIFRLVEQIWMLLLRDGAEVRYWPYRSQAAAFEAAEAVAEKIREYYPCPRA